MQESTKIKIPDLIVILPNIQVRDKSSLILAERFLASPGSSRQEGPGSRQERRICLSFSCSAMARVNNNLSQFAARCLAVITRRCYLPLPRSSSRVSDVGRWDGAMLNS